LPGLIQTRRQLGLILMGERGFEDLAASAFDFGGQLVRAGAAPQPKERGSAGLPGGGLFLPEFVVQGPPR